MEQDEGQGRASGAVPGKKVQGLHRTAGDIGAGHKFMVQMHGPLRPRNERGPTLTPTQHSVSSSPQGFLRGTYHHGTRSVFHVFRVKFPLLNSKLSAHGSPVFCFLLYSHYLE